MGRVRQYLTGADDSDRKPEGGPQLSRAWLQRERGAHFWSMTVEAVASQPMQEEGGFDDLVGSARRHDVTELYVWSEAKKTFVKFDQNTFPVAPID